MYIYFNIYTSKNQCKNVQCHEKLKKNYYSQPTYQQTTDMIGLMIM